MALSYSKLLRNHGTRVEFTGDFEKELEKLQLRMLRAQQGIWHKKARVIFAFEGMDAAGKGGAIRRLVEKLDPRGVRVNPVGPPTAGEQGRHWLYRFWKRLPPPGVIAIFDRSWYGRVLVEKVELGLPAADVRRAYREILEFEKMLADDGVIVQKFYLGMSKKEQRARFEARLTDPYKQWKIGEADIESRRHWDGYVEAVDAALKHTHRRHAPWTLVAADDKKHARLAVLSQSLSKLAPYERWMEKQAALHDPHRALKALRKLKLD